MILEYLIEEQIEQELMRLQLYPDWYIGEALGQHLCLCVPEIGPLLIRDGQKLYEYLTQLSLTCQEDLVMCMVKKYYSFS